MKSKVLPPTYFIIFLILSIVSHFICPIKKILFPPITYLGWGLILFGVVLNLWTDYLFKKEQTTVKPYEKSSGMLVSGPFKISRHPMYLGMTAVLLGVSILHGTITPFAFPIIFVVLMEALFIPTEEKNLEKVFGKKYVDYKRKVRRWI